MFTYVFILVMDNVEPEGEDEDVMMEHVPLHLAERNLLTSHSPFKKRGQTRSDTMIVFTTKENGVMRDVVLFPSAKKIEILKKSREFTEDGRPETLEDLQKINKQALAQIKGESKAQNSNSPSSNRRYETSIGEEPTPLKSNFQGREGYKDTFDWDRYHGLGPKYTFSRERHKQRIAILAQMPEFHSPASLPIDYKPPLEMTDSELFDRVDASSEASVTKRIPK